MKLKGYFGSGTEHGPEAVRRARMGSSSSGKNQGKLRINQPQLTPAQDHERKREFCVPRFVADYQAVLCEESGLTEFPFSYIAQVAVAHPGSGPAQDLLRLTQACSD